MANITCPHCWTFFSSENILYISVHPDLIGDDRLGPEAMRRFLPDRFTVDGKAIDARGEPCDKLACPHCHLPIPHPLVELRSWITSIVGAPSCGKTYLLAAMIKSLRDSCQKFGVGFNDADNNANKRLLDYERSLFYSMNETIEPLEDPGMARLDYWYNCVMIEGQVHLYPKPFFYSLKLDSRHPFHQHADKLDRVLCLYDNSGESFLPGTDDGAFAPVTQLLAISKALFFCFDPTQEPGWAKADKMPAAATQGLKGRAQEVIFSEMLERIRKYRQMGQNDRHEKPLVIIVTKFDAWCDLLGCKRLKNPWNSAENGSYLFDIEFVERVSDKLRNILQETSPSFVYRAEQFTNKLLFVPVSATGTAPDERNQFHIDEIQPMWCEVPLLATLVKWGGTGPIIPAFRSGQR